MPCNLSRHTHQRGMAPRGGKVEGVLEVVSKGQVVGVEWEAKDQNIRATRRTPSESVERREWGGHEPAFYVGTCANKSNRHAAFKKRMEIESCIVRLLVGRRVSPPPPRPRYLTAPKTRRLFSQQ